MTAFLDPHRPWDMPELGPALGRLTHPPADENQGPLGVALDDIRLELVTGIFELAGAGRSFAMAGDREDAIASVGRVAWLDLWERAVAASADRVTAAVNAHCLAAAAESRFPRRRLRELLLTEDDTRAICARLGSGGAPFVAALDALDRAARAAGARGDRGGGALGWSDALTAAGRRLESAWLALDAAALAEQRRWREEIERIRGWRRPTWPVWLVTVVVLGAATYVGLVLGGYLPVPPPVRNLVEAWWSGT